MPAPRFRRLVLATLLPLAGVVTCRGDGPTAPAIPSADAGRAALTAAATPETSPLPICGPDVFDSLILDPPRNDGPAVPAFDERWSCVMSPSELGELTVERALVDGRGCGGSTAGATCGTLTFTFTPGLPACSAPDQVDCYTGISWEASRVGLRYPPGYWFFLDWLGEETPPIEILPPGDCYDGQNARSTCEMTVTRPLTLDEWTYSRFPSDGWVEFRAVKMGYRPSAPDAPGVAGFSVALRVLGPNKPPQADFTYAIAGTSREVVFTSTSSDPDRKPVSVTWEFGDGFFGGGDEVTHRYDRPGTYDVTITVTDVEGATATRTKSVTIDTPLAVIHTQPTEDPLQLIFDGQDSRPSSAGGPIVQWAWDLGDGATDAESTFIHTYDTACTYPVTLTVTDGAGATDTRTEPIQVGISPEAAFDHRIDPVEPLAVDFDAFASFDPVGTGLTYEWDFGDGSTGTGPFTYNLYPHAGDWSVTLTITDGNGCTVETTRDIRLDPPGLSVSDPTVEPATDPVDAIFEVTLGRASTSPVTVDYRTRDGTATVAGGDYEPALGTLVFQPGQTRQTAAVTVNATGLVDGSFSLVLSNPSGAEIVKGTGTATIQSKLVITTKTLPDGQRGKPYSATLSASGGTPPFDWRVYIESLPDGLELDATTGAITGTPTVGLGRFHFDVKVTDSGSPAQVATRLFTIIVPPPLIDAVLPSSSPWYGGPVVITGSGFGPSGSTAAVELVSDGSGLCGNGPNDVARAQNVVVISDTRITATIPAVEPWMRGCDGEMRLRVVSPVDPAARSPSVPFTYTPPHIALLNPTYVLGGAITITGSGFGPPGSPVGVEFSRPVSVHDLCSGHTADASNVTVVSDTKITATVPSRSLLLFPDCGGDADVAVIAPHGVLASNHLFFSYPPAPGLGVPTPLRYDAARGLSAKSLPGLKEGSSLSIPAGALPDGTEILLWPVDDPTAIEPLWPTDMDYLIGIDITWRAPDGSHPNASSPITLTIVDPSIHSGDLVWEVTGLGGTASPAGAEVSEGEAVIEFVHDPLFGVTRVSATARSRKEAARDLLLPHTDHPEKKVRHRIDKALEHLERSLESALWLDDAHLDPKKGKKVFDEEKKTAHEILKLLKRATEEDDESSDDGESDLDPPTIADLEAALEAMLAADRALATTAVAEVDCAGDGKCEKELGKAAERSDRAEAYAVEGRADRAIGEWKKAWEKALEAGR